MGPWRQLECYVVLSVATGMWFEQTQLSAVWVGTGVHAPQISRYQIAYSRQDNVSTPLRI